MTTIELRQKRLQSVEAAEALLAKANAEGRSLNAEEEQQYERMWDECSALQRQIERIEAIERIKAEAAPIIDVATRTHHAGSRKGFDSPEYRDAFIGYVRTGSVGENLRTALNTGTSGSYGGYTVPTTMLNTIIELTREANIIRQIAQVIRTTNTTTIPTVSNNGTSYWKAEEAAYVEGSPTFGQASLGAYKATRMIQISEELLQDSGVDIEGYLARNIGEGIGALEETAFIAGAGSGADCPLGLVGGSCQASSSGIATASYTAVTAAEIIDMYHALAPRYRRNATWIMKDSVIKLVRKLTDGGTPGQFIWQPGLQAGQPDMLLGRPIYASENMPAAAQAAKGFVFGDFSYCLVGDRSLPQIQRLNELYAGSGQVGFKAFARVDMAVTNSTAIQYSTFKL